MIANRKLRVAVLMGGPSAEHEISLKTGEMVFKHLDRKKYEPQKIVITKDGRWPVSLKQIKKDFQVAFLALHGEYGEDGTIQKILDKARIPYTGSGAKASQLGMDKLRSYRLFEKTGLNIPHRLHYPLNSPRTFPLVVKPLDRGSSVGVSIAQDRHELPKAIRLAKKYSPRLIIEEYIKGREITCGVLENSRRPRALPPTEIIPKTSAFFDYRAKYTAGASQEITPAPLTPRQTKMVQKAALAAHKAIGAGGYSRSDFILADDGKLYILEINTLPGLTATSLIPQAATAVGLSFSKLLDIIIENALRPKPQPPTP